MQQTSVQDDHEEILGQILRVRHGVAPTADKRKNRPPISPAKLAQRGLCFFLFLTGARKNHTPLRSEKFSGRIAGLDCVDTHKTRCSSAKDYSSSVKIRIGRGKGVFRPVK